MFALNISIYFLLMNIKVGTLQHKMVRDKWLHIRKAGGLS